MKHMMKKWKMLMCKHDYKFNIVRSDPAISNLKCAKCDKVLNRKNLLYTHSNKTAFLFMFLSILAILIISMF